MNRHVLFAAVLLLGAAVVPGRAAVRSCNAALVTAGLCQSTSDVLISYSLSTTDPDGAGPRVSQATQVQEGCAIAFAYQGTVNGVPNSESKAAFCDRMIRLTLFGSFSRQYYSQAAQAAYDATLAQTPTDPVP